MDEEQDPTMVKFLALYEEATKKAFWGPGDCPYLVMELDDVKELVKRCAEAVKETSK